MLKYGEVTSLNEKTNRESREIELHGILQKKSRKGFYQNRYFRTSGVLLSYYKDQEAFNKNPLYPNASFKFTDMTSVQMNGADGKFLVSFAIASLELDLKAVNEAHAIHWTSFIRAKINLYSVNMLLTMDSSPVSGGSPNLLFVTTTFRQLMLLKPSDQDSWNETSLNSHFESIFANRSASRLPLDELCSLLLSASHKALDDVTFSCEECEVEFRTRNPRVVAHCREYMRRYTKLFCGRVILELSSTLGPTEDTNLLSPQSALDVICFLQRIYLLNRFSFLPAAELSGVFGNLRSLEYMCDSYVYICHSGLKYWLNKVGQLQPRQQGQILADIPMEIETKIALVRPYKAKLQENTYAILLNGSMSGMLLELREFLVSFSFADFSDEALTDHIVACFKIDQYTADICRSWAPPKLSAAMSSPSTYSIFLSKDSPGNQGSNSPAMQLLQISDACRRNAMRAAAACVRKLLPGLQDLLSLFFFEKGSFDEGWIGGRACKALLLRLGSWIESMRSSVPQEYLVLVKAEAYRFVVILYYSTFIGFYRANKKAQLSVEGVAQVTMDLRLIEMWIAETGVCAECEPLKEIIKKMRLYLTCEATDLLVCFSGSVQDFASSCPYYAYDLFRVAMKLRDDIPADYRRRVLGMCTEYMTQYKYVYEKTYGESVDKNVSDDALSSGDYFSRRMSGESILAEIMPLVGTEHCTGKKWSLEKSPHMSADENIFITNLVTEACHHIRMMRLAQRSSITISARRGKTEYSSPIVDKEALAAYDTSKAVGEKKVPAARGTNPFNEETNPFVHEDETNLGAGRGANPFADDTNPFQSDNEDEDQPLKPDNPDIAAPSGSKHMVAADSSSAESNDPVRPRVAEVAAGDTGYRHDGTAPRMLKMDNVSYEGVERVFNPEVIQASSTHHRTLDRNQVIFLHGDNFNELHASLKPDFLALIPYSGPTIGATSDERHSNCSNDDVGGEALLVSVQTAEPFVSEMGSTVSCNDDVDALPEEILVSHLATTDDATRSALIASYSAEYLLVTSENEEFEREVVMQTSDVCEDPAFDEKDEAGDDESYSSNEMSHSVGRPISSRKLNPAALFIVPPEEELSSQNDLLTSNSSNNAPDSVGALGETNDDRNAAEPSVPSVASLETAATGPAASLDPAFVFVQYVVIYGPGTVLRTDVSIDSDKLCSVPCSRMIDIFENTAVTSSEGIVRVRARYKGIHGWTSFRARDGTTIIERCVPVEKPTAASRPQKPPKRRSVSSADQDNDSSLQGMARESSVESVNCASVRSVDSEDHPRSASAGLKPPPKPPRKSITKAPVSVAVFAPTENNASESSCNVFAVSSELPPPPPPPPPPQASAVAADLAAPSDPGDVPCDDAAPFDLPASVNSAAIEDSAEILGVANVSQDQDSVSEVSAGNIDLNPPPTDNAEIDDTAWSDPCREECPAFSSDVIAGERALDPLYITEEDSSRGIVHVDSVAESLLNILDCAASPEAGDVDCKADVVGERKSTPQCRASLENNDSSDCGIDSAGESPGSLALSLKPAKPPKKRISLSHASSSMSSGGNSPSRSNKPEKPPKLHPSVPVALLYSPDDTENNAAHVAVAVAVSMPPELEVIDPSEARRRPSDARREGPQRLSRANSLDKAEEKVDANPRNPFDTDSDEEYGGATTAPMAAASSHGDVTSEGEHSSERKRRGSGLRNRLSSILHMRRRRSSIEESKERSPDSSVGASDHHRNPFESDDENSEAGGGNSIVNQSRDHRPEV